ncbi:MAG: hypothetical protein AAGA62_04890 [Bacteroidota bacterium]
MSLQKILLATVAGALTLFAGGMLMYSALGGGSLLTAGATGTTASLEAYRLEYIVSFELLIALLVAIVFERWANIRTFSTGAINGAWMVAIVALVIQLDYMAGTDITTLAGVLFFGATSAIRGALAGGVIAWVLGRGRTD